MKKLKLLDTFSGGGGFSYAAEKLVGGYETIQFCENNSYCQKVLKKHWPSIPIHDDIRTFKPEPYSADVICGGFPCVDISNAGLKKGITKETRSGLFFELMRVVCLVRPKYIILENVERSLITDWESYLGSFPREGLMLSGELFEQAIMSMPVMPETDGLQSELIENLPTPTTMDHLPPRSQEALKKQMNGSRKGRTQLGTLREAVNPKSQEMFKKMLPTPTSRDYKGRQKEGYRERGYGPNLPDALTHTGNDGVLNPRFIEMMMGFPLDYSQIEQAD